VNEGYFCANYITKVRKLLYDAFTRLYPLFVKAFSPFNEKARLWQEGRKNIFERMEKAITPGTNIIWVHCSSLGEFEQGRPVIEKLRSVYTTHKILLTFFSPSGYEVRKDYKGVDHIFYLPQDNQQNAKKFFDIVNPALAIFVKYEFWHYYLNEAKNRKVSLLLISAIFWKEQAFFSKQGKFHRQMLSCFTHFFVQNQESVNLLNSIDLDNKVTLAGDTRFDRVVEIAEQFEPIPLIEQFISSSDTIVAGSTWPKDDSKLSSYANTRTNVRFIIAPHNIDKDRIDECLKLYKHSVLFSDLSKIRLPANANTIIIDNVGMLSKLYKYGTINFVGGGFAGDGIHNVLEAAVYGRPVVFGPLYQRYIEAIELVASTGGISINDAIELASQFDCLLKKDEIYLQKCQASIDYVYSKRGSTKKILQFIQEKRLLTN